MPTGLVYFSLKEDCRCLLLQTMSDPTPDAPLTPKQKRLLEETLERFFPNPPQFEWTPRQFQYFRPITKQARIEGSGPDDH